MSGLMVAFLSIGFLHFPPQLAGHYVSVRKTFDNQTITVPIVVRPYNNTFDLRLFRPNPRLPGPRDWRFSYNNMEQRPSSSWIGQVNNWTEISKSDPNSNNEARVLVAAIIDGKIFEPRTGFYSGIGKNWNSSDPNTVSEVNYALACKLWPKPTGR